MGHGQHRNSTGPTSFVSSLKTSAKRIASNKSNSTSPPPQLDGVSESIDEGYPPSFSTKRSSTSSRSSQLGPYNGIAASGSNASVTSQSQAADKKASQLRLSKNPLSNSVSLSSWKPLSTQQSLHSFEPSTPGVSTYVGLENSTGSLMMAETAFANGYRQDYSKPPSTSASNVSFGTSGTSGTNGLLPTAGLPPAGGMQNPSIVCQHIHDTSAKRISTLEYLRKAHEGRVYWYNTLLFSKSDLARMPFFEPKRLARRATNYLLLGLSLPCILDMNSATPQEYLRALNSLLNEFESYQQVHPPEGGSASSLSRARIPSMFKRATATSSKGRRTSSAADIGLPMSTSDPMDLKKWSGVSTNGSTIPTFPASEQELLPGEEYTHLLTPSLPFDPDFFETFATLCDVLIDCYTKILGLIPSPAMCPPGTGELFVKADARVRRIIVSGIVKEFDDASRAGARAEFAGLGKVVLGGLM